MVESGIPGDSVKPRPEFVAGLEAPDMFPGLEERVLSDVLGIFVGLAVLFGEAEYGVDMAAHELLESRVITLLYCFYQLFVGTIVHGVLSYYTTLMADSNALKDLRTTRSVTQEALAEAADVSRQTIISIEKGKYTPSVALAIRIARFFKVPVEDIFTSS